MNTFQNKTLLLVEDSPLERALYSKMAESLGLKVYSFSHPQEINNSLDSHSPHFVMSDIYFKDNDGLSKPLGLDFIRFIKSESPTVTILALSSHPHVALYTECCDAGAHHFVRKPLKTNDELNLALILAKKNRMDSVKAGENRRELSQWLDKYPEGFVFSESVRQTILISSKHPHLPLVLIGETGTGKEAVVKSLHQIRKKTLNYNLPLVVVNCAAIPMDLAESIFFGHKKGAFSGAVESSVGYVGAADQGILFLDEIHCLSLHIQQKLLRVLQDGEYSRVGEIKSHSSQFQIVAATTKDLDDLVENNKFLLDLRSRLTGLEIFLDPLRKRLDDLNDLIGIFFAKQDIFMDSERFQALVKRCQNYYWQGNIRQLYMALNVMLAHAKGHEKMPSADFLPEYKSMLPPSAVKYDADSDNKLNILKNKEDLAFFIEGKSLKEVVESVEKEVIIKIMQKYNGNCSKVCRELNIPRSTFDLKRKKYAINF